MVYKMHGHTGPRQHSSFQRVVALPHRIAAANIEIEGTDVCALTLHALFDLDAELQSRLDLTKLDNEKTKQLMSLDVLLLASRWLNTEISIC